MDYRRFVSEINFIGLYKPYHYKADHIIPLELSLFKYRYLNNNFRKPLSLNPVTIFFISLHLGHNEAYIWSYWQFVWTRCVLYVLFIHWRQIFPPYSFLIFFIVTILLPHKFNIIVMWNEKLNYWDCLDWFFKNYMSVNYSNPI